MLLYCLTLSDVFNFAFFLALINTGIRYGIIAPYHPRSHTRAYRIFTR